MHFFYTIVCLCILVFNSYSAQVNALLNITEEALVTSRRLLKEVEGNLFITNEDELYKKLSTISEIANEFEQKYDNEIEYASDNKYEIWFYFDDGVKSIDAPLSFINNLLKFKALRDKITVSQGVINKRVSVLLYNGRIIKRLREMFVKEFYEFAENKYNLIVKDKTSLLGDEYRYMEDVYKELYQLFFYTDEQSQLSIFDFFKNMTNYISESNIGSELIFSSPQLRLFSPIRELIVGEAFFCVRHQYYISVIKAFSEASAFLKREDNRVLDLIQQNWGELDAVNMMKKYEENFEIRSIEVFNKVKPALATLSRRYSLPASFDSEENMTKLEVFAKYVINEVDLNADGSCKRTCSDYNQVERVFGCFDRGICSVQRKCKGKLWDCEDIDEPMYICALNEEIKGKERYKFIKHDYLLTEDILSCPTVIKKAESWRRGFYKCNYCQCKCEENETYSNRYFSLRPVTSNIYDNYVISAVGFQMIDHELHLEARHYKVLPSGQLSRPWHVDVPSQFNVTDYDVVEGKDFQTVTGDARTVCLDQLEAPNDHLLTGLRLKFQDGYFKLEIRMTQFDYATGMLSPEKSFWYSKDTDLNQRPKINLDEFLREPENAIRTEGCFQFTTDEGEYFFGQTTIPFIKESIIRSTRIAPLSGVGMILKKAGSDAFLHFQLISHDITVNMK